MPSHLNAEMLLRRCYQAGLAAADPGEHLTRSLGETGWPDAPVYLLSVGKAAGTMSAAAVAWAASVNHAFTGGLIVTAEAVEPPAPGFVVAVGDHPIPGVCSAAAAAAIARFVENLPPDAVVHVTISGGASALMASPLPGITAAEMTDAFEVLLTSGLPIGAMNALRKRMTAWSGGRLAAALAPRRILVWLLSDVPGDDATTIASGPCHGDPWTTEDVLDVVARHALQSRLPSSVLQALQLEALRPTDPVFATTRSSIVASNATALAGIATAAAHLGCPQRRFTTLLQGPAADAGRAFATEAMQVAQEWEEQNRQLIDEGRPDLIRPLVLYQGGETTVTLGNACGIGGRSQELALAAAEMLEVTPHPVTFLAAGTDGRDGNSPAVGAVVNQLTWSAIADQGVVPGDALRGHDSYTALAAVDATIVTGPTGGNVMDVLIAVVGHHSANHVE